MPLGSLTKEESLVLKERYEYRKASAELLKQLVLKNERPAIAPAISSQGQEIAQQNAQARRQWLDRLEKERLDDQVVIAPSQSVEHITELSARFSSTTRRANAMQMHTCKESR